MQNLKCKIKNGGMVGTLRRGVPARAVAGGRNDACDAISPQVAPLNAARTVLADGHLAHRPYHF